jgi:hypothetical protein
MAGVGGEARRGRKRKRGREREDLDVIDEWLSQNVL